MTLARKLGRHGRPCGAPHASANVVIGCPIPPPHQRSAVVAACLVLLPVNSENDGARTSWEILLLIAAGVLTLSQITNFTISFLAARTRVKPGQR
jgi:hypothetical protein